MVLNSLRSNLGRSTVLRLILLSNRPGLVLRPTLNDFLSGVAVTSKTPLNPVLPSPVVLAVDTIFLISTLDPTDKSCGISVLIVAIPTIASQSVPEMNLGFLISEVLERITGVVFLNLATSLLVNPTVVLDSCMTKESSGGLPRTVESFGTTYLTL